MKKILVSTVLAVSATLASFGSSAADLKMLTSWGENHSGTKNIAYVYRDMVEEKSGGDVKFTTFGPEVVPGGKQLQPVASGVFDVVFTHGLYHTGVTGIGAAIDAVDKDVDKRRSSGVWDWIDQYYQTTQNLKVLSIPTAHSGFRMLLKDPMPSNGLLKGKKIRALPSYNALVGSLEAAPVVIPFGELYSSLEKGVVDGMIWPSVGIVGFKFHEVAPNLVDPVFGSVSYMVMMNLDKWNSLDGDEQKLLLDAGYELEKRTVTTFNKLLQEENTIMAKAGAKAAEYVNLSQSDLEELFAKQAMKVAVDNTGKDGEAFRDFVKAKGL